MRCVSWPYRKGSRLARSGLAIRQRPQSSENKVRLGGTPRPARETQALPGQRETRYHFIGSGNSRVTRWSVESLQRKRDRTMVDRWKADHRSTKIKAAPSIDGRVVRRGGQHERTAFRQRQRRRSDMESARWGFGEQLRCDELRGTILVELRLDVRLAILRRLVLLRVPAIAPHTTRGINNIFDRRWADDGSPNHRGLSRCRTVVFSCSVGIPESGLTWKSSRRSSRIAFSSGVSPWSSISIARRTSSCRSANDNLGISARISVWLIRTSFHSVERFRLRHVIRWSVESLKREIRRHSTSFHSVECFLQEL